LATRTVIVAEKPGVRYRCRVCGKITAGRLPVNPHNHRERGDGTFHFPRLHKGSDGQICDGCYEEADCVEAEALKFNRTPHTPLF